MTVNVEKNKEAIEASFGGSSCTTTTTTNATGITATSATAITASREGCNCNTFNSITDPKRTSTFNRIAQVYDEQISRDEQVMLLPLLRRALIYFNARGKVLEVGAGTGRNLEYYSFKNVEKVVLTDVSEEMLLQAREKVKAMDGSRSFFSSSSKKGSSSSSISSSGSKFQLFVADAANMKSFYPDDTFDTIVDTFGLCSFDDPVAVLKELQRVCKKDGTILLLEHGRSKSWTGLSNYLDKNAERHATNWGCVWNRDLDDILEEAGLVVDTLQTWHFGTTYYVVCRPSERVKREMEMEMELMQSDITTSSATSATSTITKSDGGTSVTSDGSDSTASKTRFWNKWLHS